MARSQSPAKLYNRRKRRVRHWQSLCRSSCHLPTIGMLNMRYFWVHCFSLELFSCFVLRCKKVVFRWKVSFLEKFFVNVLKKFMVFRWKSKLSSNEKLFCPCWVPTKYYVRLPFSILFAVLVVIPSYLFWTLLANVLLKLLVLVFLLMS